MLLYCVMAASHKQYQILVLPVLAFVSENTLVPYWILVGTGLSCNADIQMQTQVFGSRNMFSSGPEPPDAALLWVSAHLQR